MPSVNFTYAVPKILMGIKRTTIRKFTVKYQRMLVGDILYLFTGMRTKSCLRLGSTGLIHKESLTASKLLHLIHNDPEFVRLDGFVDAESMDKWFVDHHDPTPNDMFCRLQWGPLVRCEVTYDGVHYPKAIIDVMEALSNGRRAE